jgi:hypothetical protein
LCSTPGAPKTLGALGTERGDGEHVREAMAGRGSYLVRARSRVSPPRTFASNGRMLRRRGVPLARVATATHLRELRAEFEVLKER